MCGRGFVLLLGCGVVAFPHPISPKTIPFFTGSSDFFSREVSFVRTAHPLTGRSCWTFWLSLCPERTAAAAAAAVVVVVVVVVVTEDGCARSPRWCCRIATLGSRGCSRTTGTRGTTCPPMPLDLAWTQLATSSPVSSGTCLSNGT